MVALNMIDTIGSGIRRMFDLQRAKFFPMPDFDLTGGMVKATLTGKVLDPEYALALAKNPTLSLMDIIMLDKLQKKKELTDEEISHLKELKLIEGRKPRFYISAKVAQTIGQKAEYTKHRAFNKQYYFDLIGKCIEEHGSITRQDIDKLLLDKLSDLYTKKQGKEKINNLISELRKSGKIKNEGSLRKPKWVFNKD
jgi:ATP-dependent DNA helicase RecG